MTARLVITRDKHPVRDLLLDGHRLTLGRHPDSDVVLAHSTVSSRHAAITPHGSELVLDDLGSSNGTKVNGQRITSARLVAGDRITISVFELTVVTATEAVAPALPAAVLKVLNGPRVGTTVDLIKTMTTLGSPGVAIVIISRNGALYHIEKVQGDGPATVNGTPLAGAARLLRDGDRLDITGTRIRFADSSE
ncbi:FHA domain-containing protein [Massilia sp. PWRC2]|uniref:FHA domain-containing protein n=1 Tax=Massilia sp. PWRC2 TaxID=2804626 RepID=UPI003CEA109F